MNKNNLLLLILILLLFSCKNRIDGNTKKIDSMNMFKHDIEYYIDKPIKYLILDSKFSLKTIGYSTGCTPFVLNGLSLKFSNDVTIVAFIDDFNYINKKNKSLSWDVNKCILENTDSIFLSSIKSNVDEDFKQTLSVEYVCLDSLFLTRHLYYKDTLIQ
ncbi:MAG: hypothetical protein WCP69_02760 [Bacteroidota bacterium]